MSNESERLPHELSAVDAALRQLQPAAIGLDRDRLMYLAGQASAATASGKRRYRNSWALSTAALLLLSLTLAGILVARGPSQLVIYVESSNPNDLAAVTWLDHLDGSSDGGNANYLKLRDLVVARGVDALPAARSSQRNQSAPALTPFSRATSLGG
jgi:hypothetical protein